MRDIGKGPLNCTELHPENVGYYIKINEISVFNHWKHNYYVSWFS